MDDRREYRWISIVVTILMATIALLATRQVILLALNRTASPTAVQAAQASDPTFTAVVNDGLAGVEFSSVAWGHDDVDVFLEARDSPGAMPADQAAALPAGVWAPLGGPSIAGGRVRAIAVHPAISGTLYVSVQPIGAAWNWNLPSVIYESTNGGANWTSLYTIPHSVRALAVTGTTIYAGAYNQIGYAPQPVLYCSDDGGLNWTTPISLANGTLWALDVHPTLTQTAIAGGGDYPDKAVLYQTTDGGATWSEVFSYTNPGGFSTVNAVLIHPTDPLTWLLTYDGGPGGYIERSTDGGATWTRVYTVAGDTPYGLVANPVTPSIIYASTWNNNFYRSTDGGMTWTAVITDGSAGGRFVLEPPNTLYAYVEDSWEVKKSVDGGDTWSTAGWTNGGVRALAIDLGPTPAALYAGVGSEGPGGVDKSTDGGATWVGHYSGMQTPAWVYDIDVDPQAQDKVFVAGQCSGGFRTADGGDTWAQPSGLLACTNEFAINPADPDVVYGGGHSCNQGAVLRSEDGGLTFQTVYTASFIISDCSAGGASIYALAVAPSMSSTVYAAGGNQLNWQPERAVVLRSLDDGASWTEVFTLSGESGIHPMAIDPADDDVVFAGGYDCTAGPCIGIIYRTTDGGGNWTLVLTSTDEVSSIVFDSMLPDTLYAADYGNRVYKSSDGGGNWTVVRCPPWETCANPGLSGNMLAADPRRGNVVYLSGWGYVGESIDGGQTWSGQNDPLNQGMVEAAFSYLATGSDGVTQTLYGGYYGLWAYRRAAPQPFTAVITDPLTGVYSSSVAWGDYDGDSDLDVLLTGWTGGARISRIYRNDGSDAFSFVIGFTGVSNGSTAWGDYDNDGDLDILLTGWTGVIRISRVYQNQGFDTWAFATSMTGVENGSAAWGDYDNDGDLDVLLTGWTGSGHLSRIYRNDGGGFSAVSAGLTGVSHSSAAWGDYDSDGDLDILLTGDSSGGYVSKVYRNDGGDTFTDIGAGLTDVGQGSVAWGDYDSDGDLDILLTGWDGSDREAALYRNNGSDAFTEVVTDTLTPVDASSAAWGDYDNDGDLDVLLVGCEASAGACTSRVAGVYRNDGSDTFVAAITSTLAGVSSGSAAWGDYDGDGDLDILLTGESGSGAVATIYRNNETMPNTVPAPPTGLDALVDKQTVDLSWSAPPATATTPITGLTYNLYVGTTPGGVDLVAPMAFAAAGPLTSGLRLLPAMGNAQQNLGVRLENVPEGTYHWSVQALDHTFGGSPFAAEGTFTVAMPFSDLGIPLTGVERGSVAWGDYDNDGDLDILLTGSDGPNQVAQIYRNDGGSTFTDISAGLTGVGAGSVAWGDYDNDGDLDVLLTGWSSGLASVAQVYRNDGADTFTAISTGLPGVDNSAVAWGDYDGDGDLDVLLAGWSSEGRISRVYRNDGANTFTDISAGLRGVNSGSVAWGDYDNDGDLDILLTGNPGGSPYRIAKVYRNDGSDTFADISAGLTGVYDSSSAWGDYDNDGDLDILLTGHYYAGGWYRVSQVYRNDGGSFADISAGLPGVGYGSAAWGDYDNDGDLDVLLTGYTGGSPLRLSAIYFNDGAGSFTAAITDTLADVQYGSAAWGDYDADGDLDILLTGNDGGGYVSKVYRNNTAAANTLPAAPGGLNAAVSGDAVDLSWSAPPPTATTPIAGLSYNVYVGTTPGGVDVVAPMAFTPTGALTNGLRLLPGLGNAQQNLSLHLPELPEGTYYWSVQAVDHTYGGSPFAAEESFEIVLPFTDLDLPLPGVEWGSVAWGDYDNDGDLDILLAGRYGSGTHDHLSKVYRNDGGNTFTDIGAPLARIYEGAVAWGDYDNDGDLDILLTGRSTSTSPPYVSKVYRNDGSDTFFDISASLRPLYRRPGAWGDYDNDGDLDILLCGRFLYRNDGSDTFLEIDTSLPCIYEGSVAWGDYDNDGDLDILLTGGISRIYRNDGSNSFTYVSALAGVQYSSAAWGDYDNDGDLDILLTGYTGSERVSKVYRNDGGDSFTDVSILLTGVHVGSVAWGDYDNDGDLDILLTGYSSSGGVSTVYRNDGGNTFTAAVTDTLQGVYFSSAAWGDYDADGDLDILLAGYTGSGRVSKVYRNNTAVANTLPAAPSGLSVAVDRDTVDLSWSAPPPTATTPIAGLTYNLYVGTSPGAGDVVPPMAFTAAGPLTDGLRLLPAMGNAQQGLGARLKGVAEGTYYWSVQAVDHTFSGSPFATEDSFEVVYPFTDLGTPLTGVEYSSVAWGDYDNDGDLDILLTGRYYDAGYRYVTRLYRNDGPGTFTPVNTGLPGVGIGSVAWGDYDNDGDLDILLTGYTGSNRISRVYRNDGANTFVDVNAGLMGVHASSVAWGDYDNDGDLDILLTGNVPNSPYTFSRIYRNDGADSFTSVRALTGVYWSSVAWGDYDNDGDLDILLTGYTNSSPSSVSKIYRNDGGTTFTDIGAGLPGAYGGSAAWGDYDNDGDLDILLTGSNVSKVYRNDGGGSFTDISAGLAGILIGSSAWGDYDNDGDLDILLSGSGISKVYSNDGAGVFTEVSAGLRGVDRASAAWGDYDADGDLDILLTGSGIAKIYRNNTSLTNALPAAPSGLSADTAEDTALLSWSAPPPTATTPITALTYNLYVGTTPGGMDVVAPMAFTTPLSNGLRLLPAMGNAQQGLSATLEGLAEGTYYWSVQAVDHTYGGSPFAAEGAFTVTYSFSDLGIPLTGVYVSSVAWGDYDNDGDLDILLTGGDGVGYNSKLYRNDGPDTFTEIAAGLTDVTESAAAWGDYDNDGDLDILLTGYTGSSRISRVYRNDGANTFVDVNAGLPGVNWSSVAWGDYDNDGDLDILLTGSTGTTSASRVYRNDGADTFTNINAPLVGVHASSVAWGDYDSDGDLDILLTGYRNGSSVVGIYRNDGNDTFTSIGSSLPGVYNGSVAWGDYDDDGDLDILLTGYTGSSRISRVYRNDGASSFTDIGAGLIGVNASSVAWGDYDNDGDLDILLTGYSTSSPNHTSKVYRNDGAGAFTDSGALLTGAYHSSAAWGDYDNDGDLDILLTGYSTSGPVAKVYRNNVTAPNVVSAAPSGLSVDAAEDTALLSWSAPPPTATTPITGLTYNLYVGTTPGGVDVVAPMAFTGTASSGLRLLPAMGNAQQGLTATLTGLAEGTYYWSAQAVDHTFAGSPFAAEGTFTVTYSFSDLGIPLTGVYLGSVAWGDYDNDGDLDIVLTGHTGSTYISRVYRNDGSDTFTDISAGLTGVYYSAVAWGDYDNDGDLDILLTGYSGSYISKVYRNDGSDTFTDISAGLIGVHVSSVAWGDYDNDGDLDILLTGHTGSTYISRVYRNDGGDAFADISAPLTAVFYSSVAWGDYDNDGDLDILLTGYNGTYIAELYRNDGGDTFSAVSASLTGASNGSVAWGDYDNDGDLDILLVGCPTGGCATRISTVYRNDGSDTFTDIGAPLVAVGTSGGYSSVAWGDYDNDGDLDILLTGNDGSSFVAKVYRNEGSDTFADDAADTLTGVHNSSAAWGDYDNDGDLDILLTGQSSTGYVSKIYRNNATTANTLPAPPSGLNAVVDYRTVDLSWSPPPPTATTPITGLSYNLYVGTTPGGVDVVAPMAFTVTDSPTNGLRLLPALGNVQQNLSTRLSNLVEGTYYWSVQAVDHTYGGSPFAAEESFEVVYPFSDIEAGLPGVYVASVAWGDYDNDGDLDILLTGYGSSGAISKVFRNDGAGTFTDISAGLPGVYHSSVAWGDYDNDGDLDILLTGYTGSQYISEIFRNDGANTFVDVNAGLVGVNRGSVAWGDYDNDGDLDILLTGYSGSAFVSQVYRNDGPPQGAGSGWTFSDIGAGLTGVYIGSAAWGDYDNDGDLDILLTGQSGGPVSKVYRNDGSDTFSDISASLAAANYSSAAWGDYDSDGDIDILLAGSSTGGRVSKVYRNDGSGAFTDISATLTGVENGSATWGDFDNDGDLDILLTGYGELGVRVAEVYRNDGLGSFTAAVTDTLTGVYVSSAAWGDYDNDGDLDILLTGYTGSPPLSTVSRNDGADTSGDLMAALTVEDSRTAAWGDYDNDGDLDILLTGCTAGACTSRISRVYRNDGADTFAQISALLARVWRGSAAWGDYDDDGDLDILLTGWMGSTPIARVYRNDGVDAFTNIGASLTGVAHSSAAWGDYDNDGDLDILLSGDSGSGNVAHVYRNDGAGSFSATITDTLTGVSDSSVAWGDYDNDGNLDILLSGWSGYESDPVTEIYRNDGAGGFSAAITDTLTAVGASAAAWGDYDGDGDLDFALTGAGSEGGLASTLYRNNVTTVSVPPAAPIGLSALVNGPVATLSWNAPPPVGSTPLAGLTYNLYVGTAPGKVDIVAPMAFTVTNPLTNGLRLLPALGNAQHGLSARLEGLGEGTYYWSVQAVDHTFAGSPFAAQGSFDVVFPVSDIDAGLTGLYYGSTAWGDYDSDGDLDLLITGYYWDGSHHRVAEVYRNDGSNTFTAISAGLTGVQYSSVAWGDYDGDGDLDILLTGYTDNPPYYTSEVYRNDGSDTFTDISAGLTGVYYGSVAWGDYDNDGDLDILLTGWSAGGLFAEVYRNDGSDTFAAISAGLPGVGYSSAAWGDYDDDGDLDILLTGWSSGGRMAEVYRNDGLDIFGAISAGTTGVQYGSAGWGDYDNDGDLDILLTGQADSGPVSEIYRNDGGAGFTAAVTDTLPGVYHSSAAWGDYDNDGDLDILLTGNDGSDAVSTVYQNDGSDTFTAAITDTLTDVYVGSAAWGDYDNDSDLDIVLLGYSSDGPVAKVYRNNTTAVNTPPTAPSGLSAQVTGQTVALSWSAPPPAGTTPIAGLTYNLYVGTAPGRVDVVPPMAFTVTGPLTNGLRLLPALGNAQHGLTATYALPYDTYYWSVQAVDHTFAGSPFAAEASFSIGPAIVVTKEAHAGSVQVGETITYTYRITNTGSVSLTGVVAYDDLLGSVTLTTTTLDVGSWTAGVLTYTTTITDLPGPLVNTVSVTGTSPLGSPVSATAVESVIVLSDARITVSKWANVASVEVGETITYTYRMTNTGTVPLSGIVASDDRLGPVALGTTSLNVGEWTTGVLTYTTSQSDLPGPLLNTVTVTGTPPVVAGPPVNGSAQESVALTSSPAITVSKWANVASAEVGETITYTYRMTNTGNVDLVSIVANDDRLGSVTLNESTLGPDDWTTGVLTCTILQTDLPGPLVNTISVTGTPPAGPVVSGSAQESVALTSSPAIAVDKWANVASAEVGETITYTYRITNTGNVDLVSIIANDDRLGSVTLGQTALAPDGWTTGVLTHTVAEGDLPSPLVNTVVVTGTPPVGSPVSDNASESIVVTSSPAIAVSKWANVASAEVGETITYTYRVTNTGNVSLIGIVAYDDHLGSVALGTTALGTDGWTTGVLTHTVAEGDLPSPLVNTVIVTGTPPAGPPVSDNASESVALTTSPAIAVIKWANAASVGVGQTITYTYRVTNTGNVSLVGIVADDDQLGPVTLSTTTLAPEGWTTGVLTYTVLEGDLPGPLGNTVVVTGTPPVGSPVSDDASESVALTTRPAITVTKTANVGLARVGQPVMYIYRITNIGNVSLTGIVAYDDQLGPVTLGTTTLAPDGWTTGALYYTPLESDLPGPLVNTVVVTGTPSLGSPVSASADESVPLIGVPAITVTKEANVASAEVGQIITYTYRVINSGDVSLIDIVAYDDQLGYVTLGTTMLSAPGWTMGVLTYTVSASDFPGPLLNTVTVTGTPPAGPVVSASTGASVALISNQAPIADAGSDQGVDTGALVTLDGSASSDPDGDLPLAYYWTQTGGPAVTLSSPTAVAPTFSAPSDPAVLTFTLTVTDALGLPSTPDEVVVTVTNRAPIADAGSDQGVGTGALVTLDGSGSSDPDGDLPLAYSWAQTGGPSVSFNSALGVTTFTAPDNPCVLTFTLTVTDALGLASTPDEVVITVTGYRIYLPLILKNHY